MNLIELLRTCDLKRAEAFVWEETLQDDPLEKLPVANIPALKSDNSHQLANNIDFKFSNLVSVVSQIPEQFTIYSSSSLQVHQSILSQSIH